MGEEEKDPLAQLNLPPGFRFYPTDEELMVEYLCRKMGGYQFSLPIIPEIDLYKFDPWVLPSKALFGEKEWYFLSPRERKYPNGSRPNRVAGCGYWKATGTDKVIETQGRRVGIKKALVFYVGKAPKGSKTNWIMHEYRLTQSTSKTGSSKLDDWVLCRIYKKNSSAGKSTTATVSTEQSTEQSTDDQPSSSSHFAESASELPPNIRENTFAFPRMNSIQNNVNNHQQQYQQTQGDKLKLEQLGSGDFNWAFLAKLSSTPDVGSTGLNQTQSGQVNYTTNDPSDIYVPSIQVDNRVDEEVQSGIRASRHSTINNHGSWCYNQNSNGIDLFGIRYPNQTEFGFGYEQN